MTGYGDSGQPSRWRYDPSDLDALRARANRAARRALGGGGGGVDGGPTVASNDDGPTVLPVAHHASGYAIRRRKGEPEEESTSGDASSFSDSGDAPTQTKDGHPLLTPEEEALLVRFYASRLPLLLGPNSASHRLRRDAKVAATSAILFRRFYLSNSVLMYDPKAVMVAAAFLASKVEDATVDVRYLEEGTKQMQSHVTITEIIDAELHLLSGINFELLCFHPYKTVLAYTEDLRTYLKSERGRRLASFPVRESGGEGQEGSGNARLIVGEDLRPMHDAAQRIVDDVIVSDVPLLYSPGEIGLAALMVANEDLQKKGASSTGDGGGGTEGRHVVPKIDLLGYLKTRFEDQPPAVQEMVTGRMKELCGMLRGLRDGKYGCGNHGIEMDKLKAVHKKLKKCRAWGLQEEGKKKKKKKKKRKVEDDGSGGPDSKVAKIN